MYTLIAILLTLYVANRALRAPRQLKTLSTLTTKKDKLSWIHKTLFRTWLSGLLAVTVLIAINKASNIYTPFTHSVSLNAVSDILVLVSALGLLIGICFLSNWVLKEQNTNSTDMLENLPFHMPAYRARGLLLAFSAAVNEELLFRAALPTLIYLASNNIVLSTLLAAVVFSFGHIYQGVRGVVTTFIAGILLLWLFVLSGTILLPVIVHFLVNIFGLVVSPLLYKKYSKYLE